MKNEDANSIVVAQTIIDDEDAAGVPVADVQGALGADDIVYTPAGKAPISLLLTIGTIASGAYAFQDLLVANPDKNFWDRPSFYFAVGFLVLYFAEAFLVPCSSDSTLNALFNKLSSDHTFAVMLLDKDRTPDYASSGWYMFATLLLCSWPYRMLLHRGLMETTFTIITEIDVAPGAFPDMPDAAVASSVNDSQ
ncbi:Hypothetical Protein FCC1311_064122 [Hondaea fermentalgiana]|uniref:Uncharacterized protein n=1 Tax=Hondaea fermentalgiana TaxID=2315210 RepID=A0A2R5GH22_9STRA|nr:Hypothetical Protein FCC1311_064122 [Hondaea fermentalgiana]|eukprot:GBG30192.1 Hypothetical Protein FCC1311_064122 [Hondaea fermentalgiana]